MRPIACAFGALALLLGLPPGRGLAEPIEVCGLLAPVDGCVLLTPLGPGSDGPFYRVEPAPEPLPTYPVTVRGDSETCGTWCLWTTSCIHPTEISACAPFDLGCGRIYVWQCADWPASVWDSPVHGLWMAPNVGPPSKSVNLHLWGWLDRSVGTICLFGEQGAATVDSFVVCADSSDAAMPMSWGRVKSLYRR